MTVEEQVRAARVASRALAALPRARKDEALELIAEALRRRAGEILAENAEDVALARAGKLSAALVDRLYLDEDRLRETARSVREVAALSDPVGEIQDGRRLSNGLELTRVRVPLGVVAVVYEARPNVTVDAAALCLKSGNAVVLRGGSAAKHTNRMLAEVVQGAILEAGLPAEAVAFIAGPREVLLAARDAEGPDRRRDPARRRGAEGAAERPQPGAGDRRRRRQLPRLRRRRRRSRDGPGDHRERQVPAARRLQRRRDAPRPPRRGGRVPAGSGGRAHAARGRAGRRQGHGRDRAPTRA